MIITNTIQSEKRTSITDQPKKSGQPDQFNIKKYEDGLTDFIKSASTPLTIALQGEWGSGKTSLMETLKCRLCEGNSPKFKSIWINTWEYSLMSNNEAALAKILYRIISKIAEINNKSELVKSVKDTGSKILKAVLRTTIGFVANGDSSAVDELFSANDSSIAELRKEAENLINVIISNKICDGIIFFIDDLDRINPASAVQLMELMKNIFTLEHCIFILAIDYDVVVKGLKPKFGDKNDKNEHEFRQFFDKIIQVPFTMPVTNYEVSTFVKNSLKDVGYFDDSDSGLEDYNDDILNLIKYSVGYNPRSIKRLINSTSLVKCIHGGRDGLNDVKNKFLNLAFIALQVVYPKIYNLLLKKANFLKWDDKKFLLENNFKELTEDYKKNLGGLAKLETADEDWEQALKLICESDSFLNRHFNEISSVLNIIRKRAPFAEGEQESGLDETLIENILKLSMTTNTSMSVEVMSDRIDSEILNTIYHKLTENLPTGISIMITESNDTNLSVELGSSDDKFRAFFEIRRSGADYLLDFLVSEDSSRSLDYEKMGALRTELDGKLMIARKNIRKAVGRINSNGPCSLPAIKIRISESEESYLANKENIEYLKKAISSIFAFRKKCMDMQ